MPSLAKGFAPPLIFPNAFAGFTAQQGGPYVCAGAPTGGTSCVQTVTIGGTPTGGTFTLQFGGQTTGTIAWTATDATLASNIATALNALSNVGASGTVGAVGTGSSGIGTYTVTFQNQNSDLPVPTITVGQNSMAGTAPTVSVATTTTGISGTLRGAYPGTQVTDYTTTKEWTNTGTTAAPNFVRSDSYFEALTLTATTATTGGAVGSWTPVEGAPIIITRAMVYVATASTGAANLSVGVGASATTSATNLIAATSAHTSSSVLDSFTSQIVAATAAESGIVTLAQILTAGQYVTVTGSASTAGMVATLYVWYFRP